MIAFLSALLAREFSAICRLPSALEKTSGAYLSAPRDFAISTALRASYISSGTLGSSVRASGFPIFWYWARFRSLYSLTGKIFQSEEHTSELQSLRHLVCRLLLEKKNI